MTEFDGLASEDAGREKRQGPTKWPGLVRISQSAFAGRDARPVANGLDQYMS
jgi:hypothetical protein